MLLKRKLQETCDYITNIICPYMWLMVWQCCHIDYNIELLRNFESCVNVRVEAEHHKGNCVKWDVYVITATICGCFVLSSSMQLWNMNNNSNNNKTTTTTTITTTIITTSKFITVHTMQIRVRSTDLVALILNLGCICKCLVKIASRTLHPFQSTPVPIIHETGWAPEPGWLL
jgi:hypothetical protein